jgi:hypothetical protein
MLPGPAEPLLPEHLRKSEAMAMQQPLLQARALAAAVQADRLRQARTLPELLLGLPAGLPHC